MSALLAAACLGFPAGAAPFAEVWRAATVEGCLAALERGEEVDGGALGMVPAAEARLPYEAPSTVWRHPGGSFLLGTAILPGDRRICEARNTVFLDARVVNATFSSFLDWAEGAARDGRFAFQSTRRNDDVLTGLASLRFDGRTPRGAGLEVTMVAQPAEGRVVFAAVETRPGGTR